MSFKRKSLLVSCLLASSTIAFAGGYKDTPVFKDAAPCSVPSLMDGFYLGAQGGYDTYDVGTNITISPTSRANPNINANGFVGGLFLGYGKYLSDLFYLGGEVFGNYSNADSSWSGNLTGAGTYNGKFTVNGSYGLALLPGIKLVESSLLYARLGYTWASLKYQESSTTLASSVSKTNTEGGFAYGLGIETLISGNWSLRGEYTYTNYNSFSTSMTAASNTSLNPSDNQFMLGVLYHF